MQIVLSLLYRLGLGVNCEKLEVEPSQAFVYITVRFQTMQGLSLPPPNHLLSVFWIIHTLLDCRSTPAQFWLFLLGTLDSLEKFVPLGRLHIRPVHFCLRQQVAIPSQLVSLNKGTLETLCWWLQTQSVEIGVPLGPFHPYLKLFTDSTAFCC